MTLEVTRARSPRDAATTLRADPKARFVAGGTLVIRDVNYTGGVIEKLVLSDGLGLDDVRIDGDTVTLGAAVTMAKIAAHPKLAFLADVAGSIGGPAVRAMATVGGNLFAPYPYGDFAVALLALDATADVEAASGSTTRPVADVIASRDGLVTAVTFKAPPDGAFRFAKIIRKKPHGASVLSIAAVLPVVTGTVKGARVAYGAMAPKPMRANAVERALEGQPLTDKGIAAALKVANDGTAPLSDPQASDWYRQSVLPVHLKRLLLARE